jgi:outer membrane protein assembly factor BamB
LAAPLCCLLGGIGLAACGSDKPQSPAAPLPSNHTLPESRDSGHDGRGVSVFPVPSSRYGTPGTQITFRGTRPSRIGDVKVVGSRSGQHEGRIVADSDGRGASFVPVKSFVPGETVTVSTDLKVLGVGEGKFHFRVERPAKPISLGKLSLAEAVPGGTQRFRSRPDLIPTSVALEKDSAPRADGDIFVAPQNGPSQDGPMILDPRGRLVWFHPTPVSRQVLTTDFRVSELHGRKVLTWWQGNTNRGSGRGVGVIYNRRYRKVATVHAGNGLEADLHEFLVTNKGHAWVIAASPVSLRGLSRPVIDSVVQEIDIKTGLVLFEWHSLDHVVLSESYKYTANQPGHIIDPYHLNSISLDHAGNVIVSMRNTSAIYKIDRRTGRIIWRLGGKRSSFKMGPGTTTGFQHTVVVHPDGTLTIFDNGAGPPKVHPYSRGIRISLNTRTMTATLVQTYDHSPTISANFEGGVQKLAGGEAFLGYGQKPYFTQFDAAGQEDFDARFVTANSSYRAYRFKWSGRPKSPPDVAAARSGALVTVWASWNGATAVARWRVLAGPKRGALRPLTVVGKRGFETAATIPARSYVAVQALSAKGRVLARSRTIFVG